MKYLKKFESLDDGIYLYDKDYIEQCLVDIDHVITDINEENYNIIILIDSPEDEFDTRFYDLVDSAIDKIKLEYPDVNLEMDEDFFIRFNLNFE